MKATKNNKVLHAIMCDTIRDLVDASLDLNIPREDLITILREDNKYVMFYYYGKDE